MKGSKRLIECSTLVPFADAQDHMCHAVDLDHERLRGAGGALAMIVLASRGVKRVRLDRGVMRNHPHGEILRAGCKDSLSDPFEACAPTALTPGRGDPRSAVRTVTG